jgi:hypothetical protein
MLHIERADSHDSGSLGYQGNGIVDHENSTGPLFLASTKKINDTITTGSKC